MLNTPQKIVLLIGAAIFVAVTILLIPPSPQNITFRAWELHFDKLHKYWMAIGVATGALLLILHRRRKQ